MYVFRASLLASTSGSLVLLSLEPGGTDDDGGCSRCRAATVWTLWTLVPLTPAVL